VISFPSPKHSLIFKLGCLVDKPQFATTAEGNTTADEVPELLAQPSLAALYEFFELLDAWDGEEEQP